jgi:hypothetical protein
MNLRSILINAGIFLAFAWICAFGYFAVIMISDNSKTNEARLANEARIANEARSANAARIANAAAETIKSLTRHIREVETDQRGYLGKPFVLQGTIDVSAYYNWGYSNSQGWRYAFKITEGRHTAHAYMLKEKAAGIREQILKAGGALRGSFTVVIDPSRFENAPELLLELLNVEPPLN